MTTKSTAEINVFKEIQSAIKKYEHDDSREGGTYFDNSGLKEFQKIARKVAEIIKTQGVEGTDAGLIAAAKSIAQWGDVGFSNTNSLGFAFKKALKGAAVEGVVVDKKTNPFSGLNL